MKRPEAGEMYRLYTGSTCRVVCIANQTESNVTLVVVHPVPEDGSYLAIPAEIFAGKVTQGGRAIQRFERVRRR